ncbi:Isoleucyl-tRNA synthetase [Halovenus aranensis]|uniref:Isoleucine--tRNA ligase n=1 Tax=Halovenus aranensis TaxID=890420 RepID=A0A1G8WZJ3_9EURY|nr:isoleucine--tRNA ligase [Halovenus aranensis]SDJ83772.1 Isoleucyl-tRNA synthetase [Halovenus aranensis]
MSDDTPDGRRFGDVGDQYEPDAVEDRVFDHWEAVDAYERTKEHRADEEPYYFLDGPPYTSGSAHMGHALNKSLKDCYIRFKRMQGHDVYDRPGYDMHGLPIETKVEEELDFQNKKDIENYGVDNFVDDCRDFAEDSLQQLTEDFKSMGVWMDWDDPYRTVEPEYMEAAWWGFAEANDRGLVEQGQRSITQCPRCETAIANNEVEYEDVHDPSIYVKFDLTEREGSLVIWTTTPWTIPANTFVAVDGDLSYQAVRASASDGSEEVLWVAKACVDEVIEQGGYEEYEVVDETTGAEMVGWEYDHPLAEEVPDHPDFEGACQVYTADYVEADRTGLVHSAPGHGEEDFARGRELGLEAFCPVGSDGVYTDAAGRYAGEFVRDANEDIIADLEAEGRMLHAGETQHSYGHCWRCDTGIVQMVTDQWFITVTDVKEDLLDNIEDSDWHPQWARENRFRDFVEEAPDWNVSRQRYWGIPIPIWLPGETTDGESLTWSGEMDDAIVVPTREELAERVDQDIDPETVDLHKGTVDDLTITEDGVVYERVPDVFDVWLDSSVASWGTLGYPSDESEHEELWPADLVIEAHDQTRGWFWSQLGMGTVSVDQVPYENLLMHGHALMPDGRAMSKSKDIRIDPHDVIDEHGVDPLRLFLLSVNPRGEDMQFSWEGTEKMQRQLNILWNVVRFPLPYMAADGFDPRETSVEAVEDDLELVDEWILSRLATTAETVTEELESFANDYAVEALLEFIVEDVSRFYVQVVRERMWDEADSPSKRAAYATLYRVLEDTVTMMAPFVPLVAEELYGALTGDDGHPTVHMADWPDRDATLQDEQLEAEITAVRAVEEAGSNARQQAERKLRWPVPEVVVDTGSETLADAVETQADLVAERLNAREVRVLGPGDEWGEIRYSATADMSKLGPAFGEDAGPVMNALNAARVDEPTLDALEAAVEAETGMDVELTDEMVEIVTETPEGVSATEFEALDSTGVVYVDTELTEGIESEGYAREVIRRVQEMRKELDLDIEEEIRVDLDVKDDRVAALVRNHESLIGREVRAAEFGALEDGHRESWTVEGVEMEIAIRPLQESTA